MSFRELKELISTTFRVWRLDAASLYGAFGSLLILLLWFYYIAQIFFLGAEFTKVYSEHVQGSLHPVKL